MSATSGSDAYVFAPMPVPALPVTGRIALSGSPNLLHRTGTPAGVGAVQRGDRLHGNAQGVGELTLGVV